jgi:hypothetical protein
MYRLLTVAAFCQSLVSLGCYANTPRATDRYGFLFAESSLNFLVAVAVLFSLLGEFAKFRKAAISFVISVHLSVRLHGNTLLPLDRSSRNLVFYIREISGFVNV